jgi:hypothetical protein
MSFGDDYYSNEVLNSDQFCGIPHHKNHSLADNFCPHSKSPKANIFAKVKKRKSIERAGKFLEG